MRNCKLSNSLLDFVCSVLLFGSNSNREDSLAAKVTEAVDTVHTKRRLRNLRLLPEDYLRQNVTRMVLETRAGCTGSSFTDAPGTYMFKPSINIGRRNVVPIVYSRRLGSDTEESEGYSITREIGRSVLWPRKQREFCFLWEPSPQNHSLLPWPVNPETYYRIS